MNICRENKTRFKKVFKFTIPIIVSGISVEIYNIINNIMISRLGGENLYSSIVAIFPITFVIQIISIILSSISMIFMNNNNIGINNKKKLIRKTDIVALTFGLFFYILINTKGKIILELLNVPADIIHLSYEYLSIIFLGSYFVMSFNIDLGVCYSFMDSKFPFIILSISSILKLIFNYIFLKNKYNPTRYIAYTIVIFDLLVYILMKFKLICILNANKNTNSSEQLKLKYIMNLIFPLIIQEIIFFISGLFIQYIVNQGGKDFISGYSIASTIDRFIFIPIAGLVKTMMAYSGKFSKMDQYNELKKYTILIIIMAYSISLILICFLLIFINKILALYTLNKDIIIVTKSYFARVLPGYIFMIIFEILNASMRGLGETKYPMISTTISLIFGRMFFAYIIFKNYKTNNMFLSLSIGWFLGVCITIYFYLNQKWREDDMK